jgi:hypothetical protein
MIAPGSLSATSLTIGSANNSGNYPNYFYGNGGGIITSSNLVIGANGASINGTYTWGDINVGGALKIGSGYTNTNSTLLLRGASGAINSGSLVVGGGVQLVLDYIGGTTMRTLNVTNGVTLEAGSSLKIVGNSNIVAGNNPRLIDGGAGQLTGAFTTVTFEGFPANVVPRIEYNTTDGDVWLVVDAATVPTTLFSTWFGSTNTPDSTTVGIYAIGGANGPSAVGEKPVCSVDSAKLYLTAIVRTNDSKLLVVGQAGNNLSSWSTNGVSNTVSGNQTNVPSGCLRKVFSVDRGTNAKQFLRLNATLSN